MAGDAMVIRGQTYDGWMAEIAALRAENERLEEEANRMAGTLTACTLEIERLRAVADAAVAYFVEFLPRAHEWDPTQEWVWAHPDEAREKSAALISERDRLFDALRASAEALGRHNCQNDG